MFCTLSFHLFLLSILNKILCAFRGVIAPSGILMIKGPKEEVRGTFRLEDNLHKKFSNFSLLNLIAVKDNIVETNTNVTNNPSKSTKSTSQQPKKTKS